MPTQQEVTAFTQKVWDYYAAHPRSMPWRAEPTAYFVLVSELMLQQTQVMRVVPRFKAFVARFPDVATLAAASLGTVLSAWNGLGYNRRAKFLWQAARQIADHHEGEVPDSAEALMALPGVGPNTAGAVLAYAFNKPTVFIETNIRTAFITHFFADSGSTVTDAQLRPFVAATLPPANIREWYWALMDYGAHIKATEGAHLHRVHHYRKQSTFEGSRRQVRGRVLTLLSEGRHTGLELAVLIPDDRLEGVLDDLQQEGLIHNAAAGWQLAP